MSELPRSAFRFDPEPVRAFVQDRLDDAGRATLADEVARMLPFHLQLPNPVIADLVPTGWTRPDAWPCGRSHCSRTSPPRRRSSTGERRSWSIRCGSLRDLVAPVAVRCTDHASG